MTRSSTSTKSTAYPQGRLTPAVPAAPLEVSVLGAVVPVVVRWSEAFALSPAEAAVLQLAACGLDPSEIAEHRGVTLGTVKKQAQTLAHKLAMPSLTHAAAAVLRTAIIDQHQQRTAR